MIILKLMHNSRQSIRYILLGVTVVLSLTSIQGHALVVVSINAGWMWDPEPEHDGYLVGPEKDIKPPSEEDFLAEARYYAKVIKRLDADIVGFVSIENENVLATIARFAGEEWSYVFEKGRDSYSGQDVGIITRLRIRADSANTLEKATGRHPDISTKVTPSRVLGVGLSDGSNSYYVVVAHLADKSGNNDAMRVAQADAIRRDMMSRRSIYDHFIIMGDLADNPESETLTRLLGLDDRYPNLVQPADLSIGHRDYSYVLNGVKYLRDYILVDEDLGKEFFFDTFEPPIDYTDHRIIMFETFDNL